MEDKIILIADDASFMRKMLIKTLSAGGYTNFVEAQDGVEAVEKYKEYHPDIVLMDITMPNKDGLEALEEIMAIDPEARVVMCSAIGQDATIMKAISNGASEFIVKPFKKDEALDVVQGILG